MVKVAAVQTAPVAFDLAKSIDKLAEYTAKAAQAGADLVVFP
jgi:predicted amidohydrolase